MLSIVSSKVTPPLHIFKRAINRGKDRKAEEKGQEKKNVQIATHENFLKLQKNIFCKRGSILHNPLCVAISKFFF